VPVSFATDIKVLFRARDISCMSAYGVLLDDYAYMSDPAPNGGFPDHGNARAVYDHLTGDAAPRMPMGGPYWSEQQISTFNSWMTGGFQP
jgi:hypothetical protein